MINRRMISWVALALMLFSSDIAWSRNGHGHWHRHFIFGIHMGGPVILYGPEFFFGPGFYDRHAFPSWNRPYRLPPQTVAPITPPIYIQQEQSSMVQPQTRYWYYCLNPEGYYPDVDECPNGWIPVAPQLTAQ